MRVTFRIPLIWTALCLVFFAGVIACLVSWFVLMTTICSNPRSPDPKTQHTVLYSCHGMKVFITPVDDAKLHWLTPVGLMFMLLSFGCGTIVVRAGLKTLVPVDPPPGAAHFPAPPKE